jgi:beta-phosphoglucomutase-like phosphatase (HAD superfamily)
METALVKAIIWDMDGVVADTGETHFLAWKALFAERGSTVTHEQFAATFGMSNLPILRLWLGEEVPDVELNALARRKEELFRQLVRDHVRALPGVLTWLERGRTQSLVIEDGIVGVEAALRAGMPCIAVTTTHPAEKLSRASLVVDSLAALDENAFDRLPPI